MKKLTTYFSKGELTLWGSSAGLILISFFLFDRVNFMTLAASLIGTTSLIFNAKGNPIGQALMLQLEQLCTVDKYSLETYVGTASEDFLESVNWALAISVGLHPKICNVNYDEIPEKQRPKIVERRT